VNDFTQKPAHLAKRLDFVEFRRWINVSRETFFRSDCGARFRVAFVLGENSMFHVKHFHKKNPWIPRKGKISSFAAQIFCTEKP
jgi:hypothetical protein